MTGDYGQGGAMYAVESNINTCNTTFTKNAVTGKSGLGGAVCAELSNITASTTVFGNNIAKHGHGGALFIWSLSKLILPWLILL